MNINTNKFHPFHIVGESPWPFVASASAIALVISITLAVMGYPPINLIITAAALAILTAAFQWWRDVIRESEQGIHPNSVINGLKWGIILFIASEVAFFLSFITPFATQGVIAAEAPSSITYPITGINPLNPLSIPILNTAILVSSGISVTVCHKLELISELNNSNNWLIVTIILGVYFVFLQAIEYSEAEFSIADTFYGSLFFMTTGFHGTHVIIGALFLTYNLILITNNNISKFSSVGLEIAIWYWHFVDVVWLFLLFLYYWCPILITN